MGSGVSAPVCDTWRELIASLCANCGVTLNPDDLETEERLLELADIAWEADAELFCKFLFDRFGPTVTKDSRVYSWILRLPFRAYMTTNYDDGLCSFNGVGGKNCPVSIYPDIRPTDISSRPIFYLHGKVNSIEFNNESIILGAKSFDKGYNATSPLLDVIKSLLLYENIIVLGARLREPPLNKLIKQINEIAKQRCIDHKLPQKKKIIILPGINPIYGEKIKKDNDPEKYKQYNEFKSEVSSLFELGFSVLGYESTGGNDHQAVHLYLNSLSRLHESSESWEVK